MPQTNSEDRTLSYQISQFLVEMGKRAGITWTIGQKHSIRLHCQNILGFCCSRNNCRLESVLAQPSENVELDAIVVRDDSMPDRCQSLEHLAIFRNGVDLIT